MQADKMCNESKRAGVVNLCPLLLPRSGTSRNGGLVAEDFVDDGDDVGYVDAPVVVEVALLG